MQKYGLDRPSEEMQETSTFSRAAVTGTDKDKERKWQYIGKQKCEWMSEGGREGACGILLFILHCVTSLHLISLWFTSFYFII